MTARESGYYWVKVSDLFTNEVTWDIAHWNPIDANITPGWWLAGTMIERAPDDVFVEIDERRIIRQQDRRMPFPVFNLGPEGETHYQTYHRGFRDGWEKSVNT